MDVVLNFWSKFNKFGLRQAFSDTPQLSLRSNFIWTFLGDSVFVASQWAMLILLAKLASTEVVGIFALGYDDAAPIMLLANLKLRAVLVTDAQNEFQFSDYLGLRLVTVVIGLFIITGIVLVQENSRETALIMILIGVAKAFDGISDILYGYIQKHRKDGSYCYFPDTSRDLSTAKSWHCALFYSKPVPGNSGMGDSFWSHNDFL